MIATDAIIGYFYNNRRPILNSILKIDLFIKYQYLYIMGCIYRFYCKTSEKSYIGQYKKNTPDGEWNRYVNESKRIENPTRALIRAIKKYGEQDFERSVLCICVTQAELDKKEDEFITKYNSMIYDNGYNMVRGGKGRAPDYNHKEEHKKKMSEFMKNRIVSDATKEKISNARKGTKNNWSEATRQSVAEASRKKATGVPCSDEKKAKISASLKGRPGAMKGRVRTKEHSENISKALKGKTSPSKGVKRTEEQKKRIGDASRGRVFSNETKKKMSESRKERFKTTANSRCKLSDTDIHYIRSNPEGKSLNVLSEQFNVTRTTISNIIKRVSYKHLPEYIKPTVISTDT